MSIDKDLNSGSLAALVNQASGTKSKCDTMEGADDGKALASLWPSQAEWEPLTAHLEVLKLSGKDGDCLSWANSECPPRSPPPISIILCD